MHSASRLRPGNYFIWNSPTFGWLFIVQREKWSPAPLEWQKLARQRMAREQQRSRDRTVRSVNG